MRIEKPRFHLIIDKDGNTNQPTPKHKTSSTEPLQDTLLDLKVGRAELLHGVAVINDAVVPVNVEGNDLDANLSYVRQSDSYQIQMAIHNLATQLTSEPYVKSSLQLLGQLGRNTAQLDKLAFDTERSGHLSVSGSLKNFSRPEWQFKAAGSVVLQEVGELAAIDGFNSGTAVISADGHNCSSGEPTVPAPRTARRGRGTKAASNSVSTSAPPCGADYLIRGNVKVRDASYRNEYVRLAHVDGDTDLSITPGLVSLTNMIGMFREGGGAQGSLRIQGSADGTSTHAHLSAKVDRIPLRTIMDVTAPEHYGDLGFDTSITGPVTVEWQGGVKEVSSTVQVDANLALAPTGVIRKGALSNVPIRGTIVGHYDGKPEDVSVAQLQLQTPATTLDARGILGVNQGDALTSLQVNLAVQDLGEFDQLLRTLGLTANGKVGRAAIPIDLHGTLGFTGSAKGEIHDLDVDGHLTANNIEVNLGQDMNVQLDSVVGDAEYSPSTGIAIASSTIRRGTAVLNASGTYKPFRVAGMRRSPEYLWNDDGEIDATLKLAHAQVSDMLQIAGQSNNVPVTGTADLNVHAKGTMNNLQASGYATLSNGVAYGEAYQLLSVDAAVQGKQIQASKVLLRAHDEVISGSGSYNLDSKHIAAQLQGSQLHLSRFTRFNQISPNADGVLTFKTSMNGTATVPNLNAKLNLTNITALGKPVGTLDATATSTGSTVHYQLNSTLVGAKAQAEGQTELSGDYQTQAKLSVSGLNLAESLAIFAPSSIKSSSDIAGTVTVSGPLAKPAQLSGTAELQNIDLKLEGVELRSPEPVHASLNAGLLTLDQLHITGQDTDLRASGTAQVFGDNNPLGGALHLNASGNISMALAHSFDSELISSGKVSFQMTALGRMKKPALTGNVKLQNVNLALDGIANGLSDLNGTLAFNQDRLDVKELTGSTGGGQLKIGGYLAYNKGLYADLNATGEAVRVRVYGLSTTATAKLRLQGTPASMLLSGNVLITRFGVGPDVDYAAFSALGPSLPPQPDDPTNKIHMDVHVASAPELDFQNSYAKLAGSVDLNVRGTIAQPVILGRILVTYGKATFAGTKYDLERGSITFSNPVRIDPVIDLDAAARVETYDITIGLHGTMGNLHPTYRSQPPLTEADIFNLLALGRTQEEAQIYQQQQQQAGADPTTNAILGSALNATVSTRVGKLFGNGSVKIDPTYVGNLGNSSARITIQEPISKQLTLTFATNVNETEQQLIQVQYQINQSTSIVVTRDENDVYSVVYKIRKRYK
ncbi:translocation/assembly module TamB domain-containing protein [Granulicella sp. 5B5]|uniref:translocation/assembly module TamB domain-containing protein n=1 Tax=Granulicella sp. 5B5 TaxID=1617967 RepID=UPI0015F410FF|nr:translocation/assembly module TamB domain-containing protein [Granulicella sp. 5B5]